MRYQTLSLHGLVEPLPLPPLPSLPSLSDTVPHIVLHRRSLQLASPPPSYSVDTRGLIDDKQTWGI